MDGDLPRLCKLFVESRRRGIALVLATIVRSEGSTYRKAGARILISPSGAASGILSGGCLEADLRERAAEVLAHDRPARILFDTRESDDPVWGLGLGCEGAIEVWLQQATAEDGYAPLPYFLQCWEQEHSGMIATVIGGQALPAELGRHGYAGIIDSDPLSVQLASISSARPGIHRIDFSGRVLELFVAPVTLPPSVLICGAGPDAIPVAAFAASLGWRVTVFDHRPAYASPENFSGTTRVILGRPEELTDRLDLSKFDAAVIMSHHLPSDVEYLRHLARDPPVYIGALGPAARRERLFAEAGAAVSAAMRERLYGPVGLDIAANSPESIALSLIAQIHAVLRGRHFVSRAAQ
ncbi:MAG: hypothetical protein JWN85_5069 [Gammaproteobacteria bacterium]|nr:hypothetical protein [Gammaproteobacteria bacterium]